MIGWGSAPMSDTNGIVLSFQTRMAADTVDQLLSQACVRKYDVAYKSMAIEQDGTRKLVTVTFTDPKDRDRFKAVIHARR
jgi:hypothetical protein